MDDKLQKNKLIELGELAYEIAFSDDQNTIDNARLILRRTIEEMEHSYEVPNEKPEHIFTVTTLQPSLFAKARTVGYYFTLDDAKRAVEENQCDIAENAYYLYCVIETHRPGIYNYTDLFSWWFKFNRKENKYVPCDKPENFKRTVSFGMG